MNCFGVVFFFFLVVFSLILVEAYLIWVQERVLVETERNYKIENVTISMEVYQKNSHVVKDHRIDRWDRQNVANSKLAIKAWLAQVPCCLPGVASFSLSPSLLDWPGGPVPTGIQPYLIQRSTQSPVSADWNFPVSARWGPSSCSVHPWDWGLVHSAKENLLKNSLSKLLKTVYCSREAGDLDSCWSLKCQTNREIQDFNPAVT